MASSYVIGVTDTALEALIDQFQSDEVSWKIRILFQDGSEIVETVTMSYTNTDPYEIDVASNVFIDIPVTGSPRVINSISLIYDDGEETYMNTDSSMVGTTYTYTGKYVVTGYSITYTN